jgi:hypothetical protein
MRALLNRLIWKLPHDGRVFQTPWMWCNGIDPIPAWMGPDWLGRLLEWRYRGQQRRRKQEANLILMAKVASSIHAAAAVRPPFSASASTCAPAISALGTAARPASHSNQNPKDKGDDTVARSGGDDRTLQALLRGHAHVLAGLDRDDFGDLSPTSFGAYGMRIATRSMLNEMGCNRPRCTHDHSVLWLSSQCHPNEGLVVSYEKRNCTLAIVCRSCQSLIARILVGDSN